MKKLAYTIALALFAVPAVASAQEGPTVEGLFFWIQDIINIAVPILIAAAVLVFLWGVLKYILKAGDPEKRKEAQQTMIWGIIGIFVMVSIWGLVNILVRTFNLESRAPSQNIEDLVDLPLGDFGQNLEGIETIADCADARGWWRTDVGACYTQCDTRYYDRDVAKRECTPRSN